MRKYILIAAMVLVSASAQAGVSRSLMMASNDEPVVSEQPKAADNKATETTKPADAKPAVDAKPAETPKYVERPAVVTPLAETPKADAGKPTADNGAQPLKAEKPKRKRDSTEARVIYELHRHGIYW
jgi:hypothetical protein